MIESNNTDRLSGVLKKIYKEETCKLSTQTIVSL